MSVSATTCCGLIVTGQPGLLIPIGAVSLLTVEQQPLVQVT